MAGPLKAADDGRTAALGQLALVLGLLSALGCASTLHVVEPYPEQLAGLSRAYEARLLEGLEDGVPVRDDGYAYAVDLSNVMRAAAVADNRPLFDRAYQLTREHFLRTDTEDPRARYTVLWRYRKGEEPGASGARETGNLANALWEAYRQWGEAEHKEAALQVLDAYLRHGYWESERRFLVKNYYDHGTNALSESTWILNQMPRTVLEIACGTGDSSLEDKALGMARFVRESYLKKGFSRERYDAGVATVVEGASGYYTPNGVHQLQSSLEVAQTLLPFTRRPAREIVEFLDEHYPDVYSHYYYDPRSRRLRPLRPGSGDIYSISERALFLQLASRFRDSLGEKFLRDYIGWEIVPELEKYGNRAFGTFYFEIPLLIEAARRYREKQPDPTGSQGGADPCASVGHPQPSGERAGANPGSGRSSLLPAPKQEGDEIRSAVAAEPGSPPRTNLPNASSVRVSRLTVALAGYGPREGPAPAREETTAAGRVPAGAQPGDTGWTIVVASFATPERAAAYLRRHRKTTTSGSPVGVVAGTVRGETRYRVTLGQYPTLRAARKALEAGSQVLPEGAWPLRLGR